MSYQAEINRSNPSLIVFLIDQSESMEDGIRGDSDVPKMEGVAKAINRFIASLVTRCTRGPGNVYPYYYVGAIGYGDSVRPAFGGNLEGAVTVCISDLAPAARVDTTVIQRESGVEIIKTKAWIDPAADGLTPMCEAFRRAKQVTQSFLSKFPDCYPPMVINITDGDATDGDPRADASAIAGLSSSDGSVLVFNIHVSSTNAPSIMFPNGDQQLKDELARVLFSMSSQLPDRMRQVGKELKLDIASGARGFAFNADLTCITNLLEIGTRSATMAR